VLPSASAKKFHVPELSVLRKISSMAPVRRLAVAFPPCNSSTMFAPSYKYIFVLPLMFLPIRRAKLS